MSSSIVIERECSYEEDRSSKKKINEIKVNGNQFSLGPIFLTGLRNLQEVQPTDGNKKRKKEYEGSHKLFNILKLDRRSDIGKQMRVYPQQTWPRSFW